MSRRGGNGGSATLIEVAAVAGVSTATAARALGSYGSVSPATRERVMQAAARLGYRANGLARSMITGSTRTIGMVVSDIENPFFSRALRGVTDEAYQHGYQVVLVNTDEDVDIERNAVRVLLERRVDGLIVSPGGYAGDTGSAEHLQRALASGTPVVLLDRRIPGLPADSVGIDNRAAARDATERLIALGHRRIALVTGSSPNEVHRLSPDGHLKGVERIVGGTSGLRAAGYRDALLAHDILPDLRLVSADGFHRADAARATQRLLSLHDPPTALLALDSVLSLGVLQALGDLEVRCPEAVSVIGFDDADWAEAVSPPLTVVAQPVYDIGRTAGELLLARLAGSTRRAAHRRLKTHFVERASTGPAPAQYSTRL